MVDGFLSFPTAHGAAETADRLERALASRGIAMFARIDHAAGAAAVGLTLPPTIVVIFGDPRAGTLLMQSVQAVALELPLKMLCWTDAAGASHVGYTDPRSLAARYGVHAEPVVEKMHGLLEALTKEIA